MKINICYRWSILLLILLFSGNTFGQPSVRDSLRMQLSRETNDTSRIKLLIQLGLNYFVADSAKITCLKEAIDLSEKKNFRYGLMFSQYYEGLLLVRVHRYDEAIDKYERCIDHLDSLHYPTSDLLGNLRMLFYLAGKQQERFRYFSEKVTYYKSHGLVGNVAICYHSIAGYYLLLADYDKAIEYYMRSGEAYRTLDQNEYDTQLACIGSVYLEWGNLDKAEEYLKSSLKDQMNGEEVPMDFFCNSQLGEIYFIRHDYKRALEYYYLARRDCMNKSDQAINFVNCAEVHLQLNARDSALFYLVRADKIRYQEKVKIYSGRGKLEVDYTFYKYFLAKGDEKRAMKCLISSLEEARLERYLPFILKYTNELHTFLLKKGDSLQALRYLIHYHLLQDSLNALNTQSRIATFEIEQQQQQKEDEIQKLQIQKTSQRNYYLIGGVLLLLIVLAVLSRLRYKRKRDKEQLTSDFNKQLAQAETKALRAQMNPHFIFNSLNSINSFVIDQKHEIASDYLIKFSKLIRLILDNSRSDMISINKELETLKLYILLEAARFDDKFKCVYLIAEDVNTSSIMIPPMLLQPFVENAIWHGLMQKEGTGTIAIDIKKVDEEYLNISITDDGIGREKAAELKSKSATHKSHGLKVTALRIDMMNKLNSTGAKVEIVDLKDEQGNARGTKVDLIIPF
ncbi:MAG: histidine kinase [Bacteroidota bacterium]